MSVPIKEVKPVKEKRKKKRKKVTTECVNASRDTTTASLKQERGSAVPLHTIKSMSICHGKVVF